jgi:hypothetical protein
MKNQTILKIQKVTKTALTQLLLLLNKNPKIKIIILHFKKKKLLLNHFKLMKKNSNFPNSKSFSAFMNFLKPLLDMIKSTLDLLDLHSFILKYVLSLHFQAFFLKI